MKHIQKASLLTAIVSVLAISPIFSADKTANVYSHAFGETAEHAKNALLPSEGPTYPDAPGNLSKACFYTKPAVQVLAQYLKACVQDHTKINLHGRSCGAGTAINTLAKLADYDQNADYFKTMHISKEDADKILAAVNKGSIVLDAPLWDVKATGSFYLLNIAASRAILIAATIIATWAYHKGYFDGKRKKKKNLAKSIFYGFAAGAAAQLVLGPLMDKGCANLLDTYLLPRLTQFNYDPSHTRPFEAIGQLEGQLTCPILMHLNKRDGVVLNPDNQTLKTMQEILGKENTEILVSTDSWHNDLSDQFRNALSVFYSKLAQR